MQGFKIALIQMHSVFGEMEKNLSKAVRRIRKAAKENAKLICFPETFNTGCFAEDIQDALRLAESTEDKTLSTLCQLAKELQVHLVAPLFWKTPEGGVANCAFLIDDTGEIIGKYAKTHPVADERGTIQRGTEYPVFETKFGKVGICICYDVCFPEVVRMLVLHGAELIVVPAAWRAGHYFKEWWDISLACRALDNLCYVAAVNQVGVTGSGREMYAGKSQIFSPIGERLCTLGREEEKILYQTIFPARVGIEREFNSMLSDRHPQDYAPVLNAYKV